MYRSDVIVGWISDQRVVNFTDRFVSQNYRPPTIDKSQDWHLLHAVESDGYTVFKFSRKLVLCDPNDRNIEVDFVKYVWSNLINFWVLCKKGRLAGGHSGLGRFRSGAQ